MSADHELVLDAFAEAVTGAAVISGDADTVLHGGRKILDLFLFDLGHGDDRYDEAEIVDRGIGKGLGAMFDIDLEAFLFEKILDDDRAFLGFVAAPAAPYYQCFTHFIPPQNY